MIGHFWLKNLCFFALCFAFFGNGNSKNLEKDQAQFRGFTGRVSDSMMNFDEISHHTVSEMTDYSECLVVPKCPDFFAQRYPTADGTCNNRVNPKLGSAHRSFKRVIPADYSDGRETLRLAANGQPLPSARAISNALQGTRNTSTPSTHMLPFWGQFLVHDIALTKEPESETIDCTCGHQTSPECINIPIAPSDVQYQNGEKTCFKVERSSGVLDSDHCSGDVRQQLNELSSYLDMGLIYGNSEAHLKAIRENDKEKRGELIAVQSKFNGFGDMLPKTDFDSSISPAANAMFCPAMVRKPENVKCRVSGEARTNENSVLLSHHTVWMRVHNLIAKRLRKMNKKWSSDILLQTSKQIVTALHQKVTFEHFLPVIIGEEMMKEFDLTLLKNGYYYGYDSSYDATVSNSFTTAAFRMGHVLINEMFNRPRASWGSQQADGIRVKTSLFNVGAVTTEKNSGGPNSFIRGLANDSAMTFDSTFSDDLRNFLDSPNFDSSAFGSDLLSRNIQRGRDHGLPSYAEYRRLCGLTVPQTFQNLTDTISEESLKRLQIDYSNVSDIDLYAGGISERPVKGGTVGPTFACLIAYQFRDLKKGDRFWHENAPPFGPFNSAQLKAIREVPFARLLCEMVSDMQSIQPWPMRKISDANQRQSCRNYPSLDLVAWKDPIARESTVLVKQDIQKTAWFPFAISKNFDQKMTASDLHLWLLINRPSEVCRQVIDTEGRTVNGRKQVRFHCLPGTISYSDFPPILSDKYQFSSWQGGIRKNDVIRVKPVKECEFPIAIQAQTRDGEPARRSGDIFTDFSARDGFLCVDEEQSSGKCKDYNVRFLCRN